MQRDVVGQVRIGEEHVRLRRLEARDDLLGIRSIHLEAVVEHHVVGALAARRLAGELEDAAAKVLPVRRVLPEDRDPQRRGQPAFGLLHLDPAHLAVREQIDRSEQPEHIPRRPPVDLCRRAASVDVRNVCFLGDRALRQHQGSGIRPEQ